MLNDNVINKKGTSEHLTITRKHMIIVAVVLSVILAGLMYNLIATIMFLLFSDQVVNSEATQIEAFLVSGTPIIMTMNAVVSGMLIIVFSIYLCKTLKIILSLSQPVADVKSE